MKTHHQQIIFLFLKNVLGYHGYVYFSAPTAAPISIQAEAIHSTEIMVSWQPPPPETQNGVLSAYQVTFNIKLLYHPTHTQSFGSKHANNVFETTQCIYRNLPVHFSLTDEWLLVKL